jgi:hypothetical protein
LTFVSKTSSPSIESTGVFCLHFRLEAAKNPQRQHHQQQQQETDHQQQQLENGSNVGLLGDDGGGGGAEEAVPLKDRSSAAAGLSSRVSFPVFPVPEFPTIVSFPLFPGN